MNRNFFIKAIYGLTLLLITIFALLMVLAGESAPQTKSSQQPSPQCGGTLRVIGRASPVNMGITWVPYFLDDDMMSQPAVDGLLDIDDQGNVMPRLATGWRISKNLRSITLTLCKGVKFHDGTDFNAEAVKYLLDQYKTLGGAELKLVTSIDVIDPYTVKLNLSRFEHYLLNAMSTRSGSVVSPTALKAHDKAWTMVNPVGTGPFKFARYERDSLLRFEKFPVYWQKGKPYLDAVEFHLIIDDIVPWRRLTIRLLPVNEKTGNFREVKLGFDEDTVNREPRRCMTCGSRTVITYPEDCMICLFCERDCPTQAIYVSPEKTMGPILPWG
jgi:ABC-type transport system substrate-binding protein/NAD-dependent dihydropyrimidine dehydrogenase PreA subunit